MLGFGISRLPLATVKHVRALSLDNVKPSLPNLRRSWLYVPCSSDRKLQKSLESSSDILIYDLEDSVSPNTADKSNARSRLHDFITASAGKRSEARIATRINDVSTPHFEADIRAVSSLPQIKTLVLPKVHSPEYLDRVRDIVEAESKEAVHLNLVASIESARGMWDIEKIAKWTSHSSGKASLKLQALLFAAEDYCADTGTIRTDGRKELLMARQRLVLAAKAFKLEAIDMVCVNYKDPAYLLEECEDGRRFGFTGKQAIHPVQVDTIQKTFVPSEREISRAARIVHAMERAHNSQIGAVGLNDGNGKTEMIDAPMLKQAHNTLAAARAGGLQIPNIE